MDFLEKIMPHKARERKEREDHTDSVVAEGKKARRDAEAEMIRAYRRMGMAFERHDWSKK